MISARTGLAWPVIFTELLLFGTAAFALTLGSAYEDGRDRLIAGFLGLWRSLGLIALILSPLLFVQIASDMAQMSQVQVLSLLPAILKETHAGRVWEWRLLIVTILAIASWLPCSPRAAALLMLLLSGALLACECLTSHAIDHGMPAVVVQFLHEVSAALWIGAILGLWLGARRTHLGDEWVVATAPWVSRLAGWTVTALLLSGLYTAYHALMGNPEMMIFTAYGRILLVKLGAASIVLLIGAYNRFILIPDLAQTEADIALVRNVAFESILLVGVVGVAALLANTPPAHH